MANMQVTPDKPSAELLEFIRVKSTAKTVDENYIHLMFQAYPELKDQIVHSLTSNDNSQDTWVQLSNKLPQSFKDLSFFDNKDKCLATFYAKTFENITTTCELNIDNVFTKLSLISQAEVCVGLLAVTIKKLTPEQKSNLEILKKVESCIQVLQQKNVSTKLIHLVEFVAAKYFPQQAATAFGSADKYHDLDIAMVAAAADSSLYPAYTYAVNRVNAIPYEEDYGIDMSATKTTTYPLNDLEAEIQRRQMLLV